MDSWWLYALRLTIGWTARRESNVYTMNSIQYVYAENRKSVHVGFQKTEPSYP